MPVCRYFLEGRCRFGHLCRDEHVGNGGNGNQRYNQQRNDNNNIYDRIGYNKGGSGGHNNNNNNNNNNNKLYDERSVRTDLTKDRPIYRYSVYGPVKDEPNLIEDTDYSPEELRLQYYIIMGTFGNDVSYQNGVKDLENKMQMKVDSTLKDLRSALNTFESKKQQTASFGSFGGNTFGQQQPQQQQQQQQTYGVPQNNFGATPSAYGSNTPGAFGSNTPNTFGSNTPSAFNNNPPSTYNTNPSNSFGSNISSAYGSNTPSAFNNNPPSAFGSNQPSAFGSNSIGFPQPQPSLQFGASAFGNSSLESNQNAFGSTPAAFGGGGGGGFGQQSLTEQQQLQQQQQLFQQQQQQQQQQDLYTQQQDLYTQQQQQQPQLPDSANLWSRGNLSLYKMPEEAPPFIFKK